MNRQLYPTSSMNDISTPEQGFRVLLASVIHLAVMDATGQEKATTQAERERRAKSALSYFHSARYEHHCEMLGVVPKLPPAVAETCGKLPPPPEPEPEPAPEKNVGDRLRVCVVCGQDVCRRYFKTPPERTTCGGRTCIRMLAVRESGLTNDVLLVLHRRYVMGEQVSDMRPEDPGYIMRLFRANGLPTRGRNGRWREEDIRVVLSLHEGLTQGDVVNVANNRCNNGRRTLTAVTEKGDS